MLSKAQFGTEYSDEEERQYMRFPPEVDSVGTEMTLDRDAIAEARHTYRSLRAGGKGVDAWWSRDTVLTEARDGAYSY